MRLNTIMVTKENKPYNFISMHCFQTWTQNYSNTSQFYVLNFETKQFVFTFVRSFSVSISFLSTIMLQYHDSLVNKRFHYHLRMSLFQIV
jgi:hypothetical protein